MADMDSKMAALGFLNADCGSYVYEIVKSDFSTLPAALQAYDRTCIPNDSIPSHGAFPPETQDMLAAFFCGTEDVTIKKGDTPISHRAYSPDDSTPMRYDVFWEKGCTLESGEESQSLLDPLRKGGQEDRLTCHGLQRDNLVSCNTQQASGGKIRVGCVVYQFSPQE